MQLAGGVRHSTWAMGQTGKTAAVGPNGPRPTAQAHCASRGQCPPPVKGAKALPASLLLPVSGSPVFYRAAPFHIHQHAAAFNLLAVRPLVGLLHVLLVLVLDERIAT